MSKPASDQAARDRAVIASLQAMDIFSGRVDSVGVRRDPAGYVVVLKHSREVPPGLRALASVNGVPLVFESVNP